MTILVVDASVVVQVILRDPHTDQARALFKQADVRGDEIVAPQLLLFEATNVIRKRIRHDRASLDVGLQLLDDLLALPITPLDPPGLHHRALALAHAHNLGAHDAHYVALADLLGCNVWADDGHLLRAAGRLPFVRWIGEFGAG